MKKNREIHREIIAMIGITLIVGGMTPISRADDGRCFADKSKFLKIDVPGAAGVTEAFGINPQGDIVGTYFAVSNNNTITLGFLLRKGTFTNIDVDVPGARTLLPFKHLTTRVDLAETFELHAAGKTRVERETRKLEDVNEAFDEVDSGKVKARLVFDLR
jgi:hypothetical protein